MTVFVGVERSGEFEAGELAVADGGEYLGGGPALSHEPVRRVREGPRPRVRVTLPFRSHQRR
jgi:hypothetical protein